MSAKAAKPLPGQLVGFMFHTVRRYSGPSPLAFSPLSST